MHKLSNSQLVVLTAAVTQENGAAAVPEKMNKSAASKVGSSLVARRLMREVKAKSGMPIWREDANGRPISLIITKSGRNAIEGSDVASPGKIPPSVQRKVKSEVNTAPRAGSKQALVIGMLNDRSGVTLDTLVGATGWLPHTTRAALTGLRKKGFAIERFHRGDASLYRIVATASSVAA
jgi:hypothetical protein